MNDYLENGRIKRVYVQADAPYRMLPEDIDDWYVRNDEGSMVQLAEVAQVVQRARIHQVQAENNPEITPMGREERVVADRYNEQSPATVAGELLAAGDIARAALFLLGDESAHITGQVLGVDAGWSVS